MKIKTGVICMLAVFVLGASPMVSMAQRAGFQIAVQQPSVAFTTPQAPLTVTRGTFVANPVPTATVVIIQNQFVMPNQVFVPNQSFTPNQVFIPNQVFVPNGGFGPNPMFTTNQVFIPNQFALPAEVIAPNQFLPQVGVPTQILVPGQTIVSPTAVQPVFDGGRSHFGPPAGHQHSTFPVPGTPRAAVLEQLGQPLVTVTTRTGETLFFDGGIKVILQNGQVTGTR